MQRFGKDIQDAARRIAPMLTNEEAHKRVRSRSVPRSTASGSTLVQGSNAPDTDIRAAHGLEYGEFELPAIALPFGTYDLAVTVVKDDTAGESRRIAPKLDLRAIIQLPSGPDPSLHFTDLITHGRQVTRNIIFDVRQQDAVARVFVFNYSGFKVNVGFRFKRQFKI